MDQGCFFMKRSMVRRNFDFYIDEYMYYCQSRRLRPKTLTSYEQTLRLFERWAREEEKLESPSEVREQTIRHYICDIQERGKYSVYANEDRTTTNFPEHRRDFCEPVSITTINNYIRNLRAFLTGIRKSIRGNQTPCEKIGM